MTNINKQVISKKTMHSAQPFLSRLMFKQRVELEVEETKMLSWMCGLTKIE